jgi:hypothetical protein
MQPVQLRYALAGSEPTPTGSYYQSSSFSVLVENLAFAKQVRILAHDSSGWNFYPCSFSSSTPENTEIWGGGTIDIAIDQFVVEYQVQGQTFWDNNGGANYFLDAEASFGTEGIGTVALNPFVQLYYTSLDASGRLNVNVFVKNVAFAKNVGIVFTTDGWATNHVATGFYQQGFPPAGIPSQPPAELWNIAPLVGPGAHGEFAIFYDVNGNTFWDNNLNANYKF